MGAREGLRHRHDHCEPRTSGRVFTRCPPACVTRPLQPPSLSPPLYFTPRRVRHWHHHVRPPSSTIFFFFSVADLSPTMLEAIDMAGRARPARACAVACNPCNDGFKCACVSHLACLKYCLLSRICIAHGPRYPACAREDGVPWISRTLYLLHLRRSMILSISRCVIPIYFLWSRIILQNRGAEGPETYRA